MNMLKCKKCLLPEVTPGILLNEELVCNFCEENFSVCTPLGEEKLLADLKPHCNENALADCMVGISGGKDGTFALIKLLKLGFRVEAFTYVHEGSTPIGVENAKRVCKELKVKHHIVSLNRKRHLRTFMTYFKSWIDRPSQTSAAMTCVACKYLYLYGYQLAQKRGIPMVVWATSPIEVPPFIALKRTMKKGKLVSEKASSSFKKLLAEVSKNPRMAYSILRYFRTSLYGSLSVEANTSYLRRRFNDIETFSIFDYYNCNPKVTRNYIRKHANWYYDKKKEDWHSDCIFHVFKEYMMLKTNGVSYIEAYVSNQIRNGFLTKEEGEEQILEAKENYKKELLEGVHKLKLESLLPKMDLTVFD